MVPPPSRPQSRQCDGNARIRRYPPPRVGLIPERSADRRHCGPRRMDTHHGGFPTFHHRGGHARRFFGGYVCGYDCGWDFDSAGYGYGYGGYDTGYSGSYDNSYRNGYGYGYGGGARNDVSISNGLTGGYVPDPVGADIPPLIIPTNCWVRRAAYDPSGAYFAPVLVTLFRSPDRLTLTT